MVLLQASLEDLLGRTKSTDPELQIELQRLFEKASQTSPYDFTDKLTEVPEKHCSAGGSCDAAGENRKLGENAYVIVARFLVARAAHAAAVEILQRWWESLARRQREESRHFVRAMAAHALSEVHLAAGNLGLAFRWSLLTHADDILSGHDEGGGGGRDRLRTQFGIGRPSIQNLTAIAQGCRNASESKPGGWRSPTGFAEEVVRRFILADDSYARQIANLPGSGEFPITPAYFASLLDGLDQAERTKTAVGDKLEDIAYYLCSLLPGCLPQRAFLDRYRAFESDIVVSNLYQTSNTLSDLFGRHILVECKNWTNPVGVEAVGYFLFRMRMTHARLGIMFAKKGITGRRRRGHATSLIQRNYHEGGSVCVVLDRRDLRRLAAGEAGFFWLLLAEAEALRFGDPKERRAKR